MSRYGPRCYFHGDACGSAEGCLAIASRHLHETYNDINYMEYCLRCYEAGRTPEENLPSPNYTRWCYWHGDGCTSNAGCLRTTSRYLYEAKERAGYLSHDVQEAFQLEREAQLADFGRLLYAIEAERLGWFDARTLGEKRTGEVITRA